MPRSKQDLLGGVRLNDFIATSVLAEILPMSLVKEALQKHGKQTERHRKLPREFLVYYVVAMALFSNVNVRSVLKALLEGLSLVFPSICREAASEAAISKGRERLGEEVMKELFTTACRPMADRDSKGAWYRQWRLVGIDGSDFNLHDEEKILKEFPLHSNDKQEYPYPQLHFAALVEIGTRSMFAVAQGNDKNSEKNLADQIIPSLSADMLLLGDRYYMGYDTCAKIDATGARFLLRAKARLNLKPIEHLPDGSYLAKIYQDNVDRRRKDGGVIVRVIDYKIRENGITLKERFRLVTNILDWQAAPAAELAQLYCERWGVQIAFGEMKVHMKLPDHGLRSKRPDLIRQEFWGFLLAHYLVRVIIHRAARANNLDPDDIGFRQTVEIIKRKSASARPFPPPAKGSKGTPQ